MQIGQGFFALFEIVFEKDNHRKLTQKFKKKIKTLEKVKTKSGVDNVSDSYLNAPSPFWDRKVLSALD